MKVEQQASLSAGLARWVGIGVGMARASEWWAYKLAPLLGTAYATAYGAGVPLRLLLPRLLLLLLACTAGATYVSLLNDWTDRHDDAAASKTNRQVGQPAALTGAGLLLCVGVGLGAGWYFWQASPLGAGLYGGAWLVYSLYSLSPFRLKGRGLAGVLADAAGAHALPQLFTATLVGAWAGGGPNWPWLVAVGAWALGTGVRNIIWHQLGDAVADAAVGLGSYVVRQGPGRALALAIRLALPLELVGLVSMLALRSALLPVLLLGLYAGLAWFRQRLWGQRLVVVAPVLHHRLLLNEYYELGWPVGFLLLQLHHYPADWLVLAVHLALFGRHYWPNLHDVGRALGRLGRKLQAHKHEGVG